MQSDDFEKPHGELTEIGPKEAERAAKRGDRVVSHSSNGHWYDWVYRDNQFRFRWRHPDRTNWWLEGFPSSTKATGSQFYLVEKRPRTFVNEHPVKDLLSEIENFGHETPGAHEISIVYRHDKKARLVVRDKHGSLLSDRSFELDSAHWFEVHD